MKISWQLLGLGTNSVMLDCRITWKAQDPGLRVGSVGRLWHLLDGLQLPLMSLRIMAGVGEGSTHWHEFEMDNVGGWIKLGFNTH